MNRPSDLQIYYQRNMLLAMVIMAFCSMLSALSITYLNSEPKQNIIANPIVRDMLVKKTIEENNQLQAQQSVGGYNPYANRHKGFLGFLNIHPVKNMIPTIITPMPIYTTDNDLKNIGYKQLSFAIDEGNDTGIYIPVESEYIFTAHIDMNSKELLNRGVRVIKRVDPEYPWVAKEEGKEGEITVLVYIDSLGSLAQFPEWVTGEAIQSIEYKAAGMTRGAQYAYKEEPEEWYFAQNFKKVLPEWRFSPRIENGKPVGSLLRIKYNYCLGVNCIRYELEQVLPSG